MRLQHWIVSRDIDGKITDIGEVETTITVGWKLTCRKGQIYEHARCPEANPDSIEEVNDEHQGNLGGITFGTYSI